MRPISRMLVSADVGDLSLEVRRLFEDLAKRRPDRRHMVSGECLPLLDVFETERTIEVVLDVPGVSIDSIRIMIKSGIVLVAGEKERPGPPGRSGQLSPRRARLRTLRARRSPARRHRRVASAGAAEGRRAAHSPAEDSRSARPRDAS